MALVCDNKFWHALFTSTGTGTATRSVLLYVDFESTHDIAAAANNTTFWHR